MYICPGPVFNHLMSTNYRELVEALPVEYDTRIDDAMVGATDRGIIEDDDSELFWKEVYETVQD
jgi:hypothetical protein